MSLPEILIGLADGAGWVVRLQLGGVVVLVLSVILVEVVARRSLVRRVAIRQGAVAALLLLAAATILVPWQWTLPLPAWETVAPPPSSVGQHPEAWGTLEGGQEASGARPGADGGRERRPAASVGRERSRPMIMGSAVALWMLGAAGVLLHFAIGLAVLAWRGSRAEDAMGELPLPGGLHHPPPDVRVLIGGPFRVPICFGIPRSTILLPSVARQWPPERLRAILLHELAHIERRDHWLLLQTRLACALYWCNPLVWILSGAIDREADGCCDEVVVRKGVPDTMYARILVDLAAEGRRPAPPVAGVHFVRPATLAWRVKRVLDAQTRLPSPARTTGVVVAVALLLLAGVTSASARVDVDRPSVDTPAPDGPRPAASASDSPLRVMATHDSNQGRPISIEIVAATSRDAVRTLMGMDAVDWFSVEHGDGRRMSGTRNVAAFELPPGTCIDLDLPEPGHGERAGIFLFAKYPVPGQHRVRLDWLRGPVAVTLRERGLNATDEYELGEPCPQPPPLPAGSDAAWTAPAVSTLAAPVPAICRSDEAPSVDGSRAVLREAVTVLLESRDARLRAAAARAIRRGAPGLGSPPARPEEHVDEGAKDPLHALTAAASDPDTAVRLAAICALGELGDQRSLETLGWRVEAREAPEIRQAAAWAMDRIRSRVELR